MTLDEGWYIPTPSDKGRERFPRWVLQVKADTVYYGKGGTHHYFCKLKTFQNWMRRVKAHRASPTSNEQSSTGD